MSNSSSEKNAYTETKGIELNAPKVIILDALEPSHTLAGDDLSNFKRRFSTLFLDESRSRNGGLGKVYHASNTLGEEFAIKVLDATNGSLGQNGEPSHNQDIDSYLQEAFKQEYETQRLSANMKGFPRLYGKGELNGTPVIIMEWIEGDTLTKAIRGKTLDDQGRVSPLNAANIGLALFDLLARMELLNEGLIHRDISPSNIMVSTTNATINEQLDTGKVELRLIDFGSAALAARDSSITEKFSAPRGATPDFAAPEMLTEDIPDVAALRKSSSIDVYAAGSVLYWLLTGHAPFDLRQTASNGTRLSPYRIKIENAPIPLELAHNIKADLESTLIADQQTLDIVKKAMDQAESKPTQSEMLAALDRVDSQLTEVVLACLNTNQSERPSAKTVHNALGAFVNNYEENLKRALSGNNLIPVTSNSLKPTIDQKSSKKPKAQIAVQVITAIVQLCIICTCAVLLNGIPISLDVFGSSIPMNANGFAIAGTLLFPVLFGALFRWNSIHGSAGFARATVGVITGFAISLIIWLTTTFPIPSFSYLYMGAAIADAACSWLYFVVDFALTDRQKGKE